VGNIKNIMGFDNLHPRTIIMKSSKQNALQTHNPRTSTWLAGARWAIVLSLIVLASPAGAATTYTWVNDSGGEYGVSANWNPATSVPGTPPNFTDIGQIGVTGHLTPGAVLYDQSGYNYGVTSLTIGQVANSTASLTLSQGTLVMTNGGNAFVLGNANPSTATFTMSGGTLVVARPSTANLYYQDAAAIGNATNSTGTFAINNGQANFLCGVEIGSGTGSTGTFTVNGGTVIDNGWFGVGRQNFSSGTFNLSGGIMCILRNPNNDGTGNAGGVSLSQGNPGTGVANISGGALYCTQIRFNSSALANETLNVSGGNIYVGYIGLYRQGAAASQNITISGGTFHTVDMVPVAAGSTIGNTNTVQADGTNWSWDANLQVNLTNSTFLVNGQSGPGYVTFAPEATRTITLNAPFSGVGGLAMSGPGTLALNGNSSYTGPTTIRGGTVAGTGSVQGDVTAQSASTLAPGSSVLAGTLTLGGTSLTLNANTNVIKLSSDPTQIGVNGNDLLSTLGNLTLSGVSTIKVVPLAPLSTASPYSVIQYGGTPLLASDAAHFHVISDSPRYGFSVVDPSTTYPYVEVSVSGNPANLVWKGGTAPSPNNWDHTTANWFNTNSSASDVFYNGDVVVFDDTANVSAVTVVGSQTPASMTMSNNPLAFTFTGAGPLGGPLDVEGANGLTTLATTNVPVFTTITLNNGTLAFNLANGGVNPIYSVISDNGEGNGTLMQAGTNALLLSADNTSPGFYGTIAVTNGTLQYTNANCLGQYTSPLYATNGGSLDVHGVSAGLKNVIIAGGGFNGGGAVVDTSAGGIANDGLHTLTLAADASVGASNRWDIYGGLPGGGSMTGNGHKLTHLGPGTVIVNSMGDIGVGDIHVVAGRLGFQGPVNMGDPSKTITLESNTTLTFYSATNTVNGNGNEDKVMVLNGNTQIDSGGFSNNFQGPITLNGTNNLMGLRVDLHLWGGISGTGSMAVGFSSVGSVSNNSLWLDGNNTYSGATIISNYHKVVVGASSSLGSSSPILVNSGGTLDVSAPSTFALGAGRVLMGNGTVVGGNVVFNSGSTLAPGFADNNTYALTMSPGNLTLNSGSTNLVVVKKTTGVANDTVTGLSSVTIGSGTTLVINNVGSALAAGDAIQLFTSTMYSGSFATIIPATPGPGLAWSSSTLDTDGKLRVVAIAQPDISSIVVGGGNVVLSGTNNGSASTHYVVLSQTNVALPLNQWQPLVTNPFNPDGSFGWTYTMVPAEPSRFYRLQLQ
jgi:autotransporter-associated beta strand protein